MLLSFWSGQYTINLDKLYYVTSSDPTVLYNLGYALGQRDSSIAGTQINAVILFFGAPERQSGTLQPGTLLFDASNTFISTNNIELAAREFGHGYWVGTASDRTSQITLAIGTSNNDADNEGEVTFAHGKAWAQMVNNVQTWLASNSYSGQVTAAGASDMELGWNNPTATYAWVDGYDSVNTQLLYNFGDAEGCPQSGNGSTSQPCAHGYPSYVPTPRPYQWTQANVWHISWELTVTNSLPQIYANGGASAKQWQQIALYSYISHSNNKMYFSGSLTQFKACVKTNYADPVCNGADSTPDQGSTLLWNALNIGNDARTTQIPRWSTDISKP